MNNLRIRTRLIFGFGIVVLLTLGIIAFATVLMKKNKEMEQHIFSNVFEAERNASQWYSLTYSNGLRTVSRINTESAEYDNQLKTDMTTTSAQITEYQKRLENLVGEDPETKMLLSAVSDVRKRYLALRDKVFAFKKSGDSESVKKIMASEFPSLLKEYELSIKAVSDKQNQRIQQSSKQMSEHLDKLLLYFWIFGISAVVLSCIFVWRLTIGITRPVQDATRVMDEISKGNLAVAFPKQIQQDEIGALIQSLSRMRDSLERTIANIREVSGQIIARVSTVASENSQLSDRTENQAAALEQTASSIEQIASTIAQTAENSKQASGQTTQAYQITEQGERSVRRVVETMGQISASSVKIADIVGVIESIAFQTNILALNAAVEAARAGDMGKGFAVVAVEVRNLAQRSSGAAKEIKGLIEKSTENVRSGMTQVEEAGVEMQRIMNSIREIQDAMSSISMATSEQTTGVREVTAAISQIEGSTQKNSSLVRELSGATSSLQDQVRRLDELLGAFSLRGSEKKRY